MNVPVQQPDHERQNGRVVEQFEEHIVAPMQLRICQ
jgi:hypothetical protein